MSLTNEPSHEFERLLSYMNQGVGQRKSTTDRPAPADSGQRRESASDMKRDWTSVVTLSVLLGFMWGFTWLILTHV